MNKVKPILRWPGGKSRQLKYILPLIKPHHCYCEHFAGGIALLLAKQRSRKEVINDTNGTLVALYRNVQYHLPALISEIEYFLNSRQTLFDFLAQPGLTEIQRTARWLACNRLSFSGNGYSFSSSADASRQNVQQSIHDVNLRLDKVIVEHLDYHDCVRIYDSPDTLHFFDPPYLNAKPAAYKGWTENQMGEFGEFVRSKVKGKWIVTVDGSSFNRKLFKGCRIRELSVRNGCIDATDRGRTDFKEFIITKT